MNTIIFTLFFLFVILLAAYFAFRWQRKYAKKIKYKPTTKTSYLTVDDFKIRYSISGQGPKLVLIHGIGANLNTWDSLIPYLEDSFTILRFDLPGFGESSKLISASYNLDHQCERILKILEALDFTPCFLCGSSMGGAIALWLGKLKPNLFKKIITLAPATNKNLLPLNPKRLLISSRLTSLALNEQTMRLILNRVVHNTDLINPLYIEKYLRHFKNQPASIKTFLGATEVIADKRLPKQLTDLEIPVSIYWGQHDKMVPFKYMDELSHILPNSSITVDSTAGHHSMEDNPKGLSSHIKVFLLS